MFLTPEIAKAHLRIIGDDEDARLALKSDAAEKAVIAHIDRDVFENQAALNAALALIPAALVTDKDAYAAADAAADLIEDYDLRLIEKAYASDVYTKALFAAARTRRGILIDSVLLAEMQLALEDLWESRPYTATALIDNHLSYA